MPSCTHATIQQGSRYDQGELMGLATFILCCCDGHPIWHYNNVSGNGPF